MVMLQVTDTLWEGVNPGTSVSLIRALSGFGPCLQGGIEGEEMSLAKAFKKGQEEASAIPEAHEDHALRGSSSSLSTSPHEILIIPCLGSH